MLELTVALVAEEHFTVHTLIEDDIRAVRVDRFDGNFLAVGYDDVPGLHGLDRFSVKGFGHIQGQGHHVPFLVFDVCLHHPVLQVVHVDRDGLRLDRLRAGGANHRDRQRKGSHHANQFFHWKILLLVLRCIGISRLIQQPGILPHRFIRNCRHTWQYLFFSESFLPSWAFFSLE